MRRRRGVADGVLCPNLERVGALPEAQERGRRDAGAERRGIDPALERDAGLGVGEPKGRIRRGDGAGRAGVDGRERRGDGVDRPGAGGGEKEVLPTASFARTSNVCAPWPRLVSASARCRRRRPRYRGGTRTWRRPLENVKLAVVEATVRSGPSRSSSAARASPWSTSRARAPEGVAGIVWRARRTCAHPRPGRPGVGRRAGAKRRCIDAALEGGAGLGSENAKVGRVVGGRSARSRWPRGATVSTSTAARGRDPCCRRVLRSHLECVRSLAEAVMRRGAGRERGGVEAALEGAPPRCREGERRRWSRRRCRSGRSRSSGRAAGRVGEGGRHCRGSAVRRTHVEAGDRIDRRQQHASLRGPESAPGCARGRVPRRPRRGAWPSGAAQIW